MQIPGGSAGTGSWEQMGAQPGFLAGSEKGGDGRCWGGRPQRGCSTQAVNSEQAVGRRGRADMGGREFVAGPFFNPIPQLGLFSLPEAQGEGWPGFTLGLGLGWGYLPSPADWEEMQELIAGVEKLMFNLERDVAHQRGALLLPFPGMDKSGASVCEFFLRGLCAKGLMCPFRHIRGEKTVVCKHWLRGLCKRGDQCEFLHEYDMTKMPECYFYSKFGECSNRECPFLHIDPASRIKDCPCPKADLMLCNSDLSQGLLLPSQAADSKSVHEQQAPEVLLLSRQPGARAAQCQRKAAPEAGGYPYGMLRPLGQVTCFKCGDKGHYANKCSKSRLGIQLGK
ncbi:putative cleavage and polyadenylation specificity factor subunit 4-like protein isoform X4 [Dermochelys coriacea]|uniref:putative cleavage and polyadenylation specificity factor subunit 4-like protein isoform X4 n=1 Tax=Dermochelys coriacea TaxID=27794 RepID=UPI001CA85E4A|nr:putative cleavage and polyadenylation specificity factor subunit 4-like protein isoform X4 [Dermochelys coriacea]